MSDDKKDEVVEEVKLPPTQLISVVCSTCNHPFRARSSEAFTAAREDHITFVHTRKLPLSPGLISDDVALALTQPVPEDELPEDLYDPESFGYDPPYPPDPDDD